AFAVHAVAHAAAASACEVAGRVPVTGCGARGDIAPERRAYVRYFAVAQTLFAQGLSRAAAGGASLSSRCDSGMGPHRADRFSADTKALRLEAAACMERRRHHAAGQERRLDRSTETQICREIFYER